MEGKRLTSTKPTGALSNLKEKSRKHGNDVGWERNAVDKEISLIASQHVRWRVSSCCPCRSRSDKAPSSSRKQLKDRRVRVPTLVRNGLDRWTKLSARIINERSPSPTADDIRPRTSNVSLGTLPSVRSTAEGSVDRLDGRMSVELHNESELNCSMRYEMQYLPDDQLSKPRISLRHCPKERVEIRISREAPECLQVHQFGYHIN